MKKSHRIALRPTPEQESLFRQHAGYARFAYNWAVGQFQAGLRVDGAVVAAHQNAVRQQTGEMAVDGRVGLAQDERQLRRFDQRRPAEGVEQMSVGERHASSVAKEGRVGQPSHVSVGAWEGRRTSETGT